jgi:glycerol transport system ATP-binding protein
MKWRLRQTLRRVQEELAVTMIYVTHDQTEALTFADQVAVMADGGLLQVGTPEQIYATPSCEFVGYFIGSPGMNFVDIERLESPFGVAVGTSRLGFRPEWASLKAQGQGQLTGTVRSIQLAGTAWGVATGVVRLDTAAGQIAVRGELNVSVGQHVGIELRQHLCFSAQGDLVTAEYD